MNLQKVRNVTLSQPLLQDITRKHEAILEQKMVVPKGLSMENAVLCIICNLYLENSVCKCLNNGQ